MAQSFGQSGISQSRAATFTTARSLQLVSSGAVRKCGKESMMAKLRKRTMKWGLSAAKVGLAASIMVGPAVSTQASELDGFDGLDFWALVRRGLEEFSSVWFGAGRPLKESAIPTTGDYRIPTQRASDQVLFAVCSDPFMPPLA